MFDDEKLGKNKQTIKGFEKSNYFFQFTYFGQSIHRKSCSGFASSWMCRCFLLEEFCYMNEDTFTPAKNHMTHITDQLSLETNNFQV